MAPESIIILKREYDSLKRKASLFEHYVESERLSKEDLNQIKKALKGPYLSKSEFLRRHSYLS